MDAAGCPQAVLKREAEVLIGLPSIVESNVRSQLDDRLKERLSERFSSSGC